MYRHAHQSLRQAAILAALLYSTTCLFAADAKTLTQKPEILPVAVLGEPTDSQTPESRQLEALLKKGPQPFWIWGADDNRRYVLRKEFETRATAGRLKAACDNHMRLLLNGQEITRADDWSKPIEVDISKLLKPGKNVLEADVTNTEGPAGFLLKVVLTQAGEAARYLISDDNWQASEPGKSLKPIPARKIAKLGGEPWKDVFAAEASLSSFSNVFRVPPGFQVERLFSVPKEELGSWVCIAFDNKGRLIASDEGQKGLCRITLPPLGSSKEVKVERIATSVTAAQGLLWAFDSLYAMVNGGPGSGLYRLRDTCCEGELDEVMKLRPIAGAGEHGPHAIRLAPDGKSLYFVCGNHTNLPAKIDASRNPSNWGEDLLLPRQWDANGHARGILAPGGWIAKTDPDSKKIAIVSIGYRNAYRFAFNADGEMFAYDSDMEWDVGMPWYRPTRLTHATSGSEFGWRSGTGKWPAYYVDSLPPVLDIGPGSPVGMTFGYGTRFPAKYQKALYLLDWTFGTIYAVHLEPDGSSYK
ncbi:MAG TPA: heme-binding protein, partial [Gemmataceae bacterium]